MDDKIKFPNHVVIIDIEFLNFMLTNFHGFLSKQLNRDVEWLSMADFLTLLGLDAEIEEGQRDIQVLLLHSDKTKKVACASPSDLIKELNGVAFKSSLGEFIFSSVSTAGLTSIDGLYTDLLELALSAENVEKVLLVADEAYDKNMQHIIREKGGGKTIYQFRMTKPSEELACNWDMLVFPLMRAFGVASEEIK